MAHMWFQVHFRVVYLGLEGLRIHVHVGIYSGNRGICKDMSGFRACFRTSGRGHT